MDYLLFEFFLSFFVKLSKFIDDFKGSFFSVDYLLLKFLQSFFVELSKFIDYLKGSFFSVDYLLLKFLLLFLGLCNISSKLSLFYELSKSRDSFYFPILLFSLNFVYYSFNSLYHLLLKIFLLFL